jgi:hypothetical protein
MKFASLPTRLTLIISEETNTLLRRFLANQISGGKKGDISRFVEEAILARIQTLTATQAKVSAPSEQEDLATGNN